MLYRQLTLNSSMKISRAFRLLLLRNIFPSLLLCDRTHQSYTTGTKYKSILDGVELKTSAYDFPPIFSIAKTKDGNFTYSGLGPEILVFFSDYFNTKFKFVHVKHNDVVKRGLIPTLLSQIDTNAVDLAAYPFEVSLQTLEHMGITYPIWMMGFKLLQLFPKEESRLKIIIRPFSWNVWIWFLVSVILFVSLMSIMAIQVPRNQQNITPRYTKIEIVYRQFEYMLTIMLLQGNYIPYKARNAIKIAAGTWMIAMVVLVNGYTSVIACLMTVPKLEPTINTLDEVAASNGYKLTLEKGSFITHFIMDATNGSAKENADHLRQDPTLFYGDAFEMIQNVMSRNALSLIATDLSAYYVREAKRSSGQCKLAASTHQVPDLFMTWQYGMPKGSVYNAIMSSMAVRFWDHGYVWYWKNKYLPTDEECNVNVPPKGKMKPLILPDLFVAFVVLLVGAFLSLISFIGEVLYTFMKHY